MREQIEQSLRDAKFDVVAASSGAEALRYASGERFDAILTDLHMPGLGGIEFLLALRAIPSLPRGPRSPGHSGGRYVPHRQS